MAKLIRDRSTKEKDRWWSEVARAAESAPTLTYERRSATMAIRPICDRCSAELKTPGAVILSPPRADCTWLNAVLKFHVCEPCWERDILPMIGEEEMRTDGD